MTKSTKAPAMVERTVFRINGCIAGARRGARPLALAAWSAFALFGGGLTLAAPLTFIPGIDRLAPGGDTALPAEPILRVETGNHSARILSLAVDRSGRWLVTSGADKSARVWDVASGRALQVLRPPIAAGIVGDISRVAISPDGNSVAVAWRSSATAAIYLFDRASGRVITRIDALLDVASDLRFSPNGRLLGATLVRGGVQLFEVPSGQERGRDLAYQRDAYSLDFSPNGQQLLTSSLDGNLRLYSIGNGQLQKMAEKSATYMFISHPLTARFSPDGQWIAVGYDRIGGVNIYRASDLQSASPLKSTDINSNMPHLAWSSDGRFLYAVGVTHDGAQVMRRWQTGVYNVGTALGSPLNTLSTYTDIPLSGAGGILASPVPLPDGGVVVATSQPTWGVVKGDGTLVWMQQDAATRHASYIAKPAGGPTLPMSADASRVGFYYQYGTSQPPASFDLPARELRSDAAGLTAATQAMPGLKVSAGVLSLNGHPLTLAPNEIVTTYAVAPASQRVVVGTTLSVRLYDAAGQLIATAPSWADAVGISGDGRWIVADLADGTVRWLSAQDGREVLALYPDPDRRRWILWTPSGYYACSPGGEDLIGWQINRGAKEAADFYPISRFRNQFYRPDVVAKVLEAGDEAQALRLANSEAGRPVSSPIESVQAVLPPVVSIIEPQDGASVSSAKITVKFAIRSNGAPILALRARVNGHPVVLPATPSTGDGAHELSIPVPSQDAEIEVFAENKNATSAPATVRVTWQGPSSALAGRPKPKLYILAVGVSRYDNPDYRLQLAAKDAMDFAQAMAAQKGLAYRDVESKVLTDSDATAANVLSGLKWLQLHVTADDYGVVLLAGHGLNDASGDYYFAPANIDLHNLKHTGVVFSAIKNTLINLPGTAVFFVDTCHSGNVLGGRHVDTTGMVNELISAENGVVVLSASKGTQSSLEDIAWGNGAFTKAILEGLGGSADYSKSGRITLKMMDLYISQRVEKLTNGQQTPVIIAPYGLADFLMAATPASGGR